MGFLPALTAVLAALSPLAVPATAPQEDPTRDVTSPVATGALETRTLTPDQIAFTVHLDELGCEPLPVSLEEWDAFTSYIRGIYPVHDEAFFLTRVVRQILDQKVALMVHREHIPELTRRCAEIMQRLDEGAKFPRIAKLYTEDSNSRQLGGLTGEYGRTLRRYPLERTVFEMEVGQHAGPFWTQHGAEIFFVEDRSGERGTMNETLRTRFILLRWPEPSTIEGNVNSLVRQHLKVSTTQERFRRVLPPGLQIDPPAQFGPTDVAPIGDPNKPLTQLSDLDSKNGKVPEGDGDDSPRAP